MKATERPLTQKGARYLARLVLNANSAQSWPDMRPLAEFVLRLPLPKKRKRK